MNNGRVTADMAGARLLVTGNGITNNGTFEVKNDAVLAFGGTFQADALGNLVNSGGTLEIAGNLDNAGKNFVNGSPIDWRLGNNGKITGGTVQTLPGHHLMIAGGTATLDGVTLEGTVQLPANASARLSIVNGVSGTGTILFSGPHVSTNTIGNFFGNSFQPTTIGEGITVRGASGTIRELVNHGTVYAETGSTIELFSKLTDVWNEGTLKIATGGKMTSADVVFGDGGTLEVDLGDASSQALLTVYGFLDLSSQNDFLNLIQLPGGGSGPFLIATYTGALTGVFDNVTPGYVVDYSTPQKIFVSVPEPTSLALAAVATGLVLRRRRGN